ncbi:MAG: hypothetical protein IKG96_05035 [Bacteroidaceae bacterium]|jgi:hypothetical protein|nr:hypothetical protein [Bacteroidaceae bacterium]
MNENIDTLISATLDRQHLVAEINRATLSDLRRTVRRRRLRRWARVVAFAFTMPLIVFACAYLLYMYVLPAMQPSDYALLLIIPFIALFYSFAKAIRNFVPESM